MVLTIHIIVYQGMINDNVLLMTVDHPRLTHYSDQLVPALGGGEV